jgi:hypothetical protein
MRRIKPERRCVNLDEPSAMRLVELESYDAKRCACNSFDRIYQKPKRWQCTDGKITEASSLSLFEGGAAL